MTRTRDLLDGLTVSIGNRFISIVVVVLVVVIVIIIVVVVIHLVVVLDKGIRDNRGQVFVLQLVVTLADVRRQLVHVLLVIDRAAEEQLPLRIFRRENFLSIHGLELHFAFFVTEHDRGLAEIDRGRFHRAFVAAKDTHLARIPLRLALGLPGSPRSFALRLPAGPPRLTLRVPDGLANVWTT